MRGRGKKTGGRQKGTPNKATSAAAIRAEIAASGELPLDYMLRVMRDETQSRKVKPTHAAITMLPLGPGTRSAAAD
jgi:hypothetical protein